MSQLGPAHMENQDIAPTNEPTRTESPWPRRVRKTLRDLAAIGIVWGMLAVVALLDSGAAKPWLQTANRQVDQAMSALRPFSLMQEFKDRLDSGEYELQTGGDGFFFGISIQRRAKREPQNPPTPADLLARTSKWSPVLGIPDATSYTFLRLWEGGWPNVVLMVLTLLILLTVIGELGKRSSRAGDAVANVAGHVLLRAILIPTVIPALFISFFALVGAIGWLIWLIALALDYLLVLPASDWCTYWAGIYGGLRHLGIYKALTKVHKYDPIDMLLNRIIVAVKGPSKKA